MSFAMLPDWLTRDDLGTGRLELVMPNIEWPTLQVSAIYADRSYFPAKVRSFRDFLAGPQGLSSAGR